VPYTCSARTQREGGHRIAEDLARRRSFPFPVDGYAPSSRPPSRTEAGSRLGGIAAHTLILHGIGDRMVPGPPKALADRGARIFNLRPPGPQRERVCDETMTLSARRRWLDRADLPDARLRSMRVRNRYVGNTLHGGSNPFPSAFGADQAPAAGLRSRARTALIACAAEIMSLPSRPAIG
jgi:hypothetical protein